MKRTRQLVVSADDMDLDAFCLHLTLRHGQSLAGPHGALFKSEHVWDLWLDEHDDDHRPGSHHLPKDKHTHAEPLY